MVNKAVDYPEGMSLAIRPTGILLGTIFSLAVWFLPQFFAALIRGMVFNGTLSELGNLVLISLFYGFYFLFVWLWLRFKEKRPFRSIGFPKTSQVGKQILIGALAGAVSVLIVVGLTAAIGGVTVRVTPAGITGGVVAVALMLFFGFVIQGTAEEVLYRGHTLQVFRKPLGLMAAIGAQAVIFAFVHGNFTFMPLVNLVLAGVMFALWAVADNSLWGASAFHVLWNWMLGIVFGGVTSGHGFPGAVLQTEPTTSSPLFSGGQFGLEGSLFTTALYVFLCFLLYRSIRQRRQLPQATLSELY